MCGLTAGDGQSRAMASTMAQKRLENEAGTTNKKMRTFGSNYTIYCKAEERNMNGLRYHHMRTWKVMKRQTCWRTKESKRMVCG